MYLTNALDIENEEILTNSLNVFQDGVFAKAANKDYLHHQDRQPDAARVD